MQRILTTYGHPNSTLHYAISYDEPASPETLQFLLSKGELPCQKIGGEWRFSKKALFKWLEKGGDKPKDGKKAQG